MNWHLSGTLWRKGNITKLIQTCMTVLEEWHHHAKKIQDLEEKQVQQFLVQLQKELWLDQRYNLLWCKFVGQLWKVIEFPSQTRSGKIFGFCWVEAYIWCIHLFQFFQVGNQDTLLPTSDVRRDDNKWPLLLLALSLVSSVGWETGLALTGLA